MQQKTTSMEKKKRYRRKWDEEKSMFLSQKIYNLVYQMFVLKTEQTEWPALNINNFVKIAFPNLNISNDEKCFVTVRMSTTFLKMDSAENV